MHLCTPMSTPHSHVHLRVLCPIMSYLSYPTYLTLPDPSPVPAQPQLVGRLQARSLSSVARSSLGHRVDDRSRRSMSLNTRRSFVARRLARRSTVTPIAQRSRLPVARSSIVARSSPGDPHRPA